MKIRVTLFALALIAAFSFAHAQTKQLVEHYSLAATPVSSHTFDDFQVQVYDDGSVTLSGAGSYEAGAPQMILDYAVDMKNQTYTVTVADPETLPMAMAQKPNVEIEFSNTDPGLLGDPRSRAGSDASDSAIRAVLPGYWWGRVQVRTFDPVFIQLTNTSNQLNWYTYPSGYVYWTYYHLSWWAANPSALGTHWFISNYSHFGPFPLAAGTQVYHRMSGDYYNYDFGIPSYRTDVHETAAITARNDGYFNYSWNHTDSGEGAWLIFGRLVLN